MYGALLCLCDMLKMTRQFLLEAKKTDAITQ